MRSTTRIFHWQVRTRELAKFFAHPKRVAKSDPEEERQLRLFLVFSDLGLVFGTLFGTFYFLVGHRWAALIVGAATVSLALAPWVARVRGVAIAGSLYALILVAGFTALSGIEGGMHGHAIAWLAVLPLSTCILAGSRVGAFWSGLCLVLVGVFWVLEIRQVPVPALYPKAWGAFITGSGYLALTVFMSLLGVFFENGRRRSLERLQTALQELSVANERLRCLDAERREFLGIAAHDLRGPLTLIVGHAQLGARRFSADAPETESFRQIGAAGDRMRALLDGLLGDQAIEEGRLDLCPVDCDTERLTADALARHRPAAERKGIPLRHVPAARSAYVRADRGALDQILDNLISNALKFSPPGPAGHGRDARGGPRRLAPGFSGGDGFRPGSERGRFRPVVRPLHAPERPTDRGGNLHRPRPFHRQAPRGGHRRGHRLPQPAGRGGYVRAGATGRGARRRRGGPQSGRAGVPPVGSSDVAPRVREGSTVSPATAGFFRRGARPLPTARSVGGTCR